jgi:hypothetical protein
MKGPDYSEETKSWLEKAKKFEQPYGHSHRNGTLLLSVIKGSDRAITQAVLDVGFGWWRAIDEIRPRRIFLSAKTLSRRVRWDPGDRLAVTGEKAEIRIQIPQPHPEQTIFRDNDESCRFLVEDRGQETIDSSCSATKQQLKSSFFADRSGGGKMASHDWLLAIAKGVEGIPGGKVLLGPLIKLREDQKSAARNEQIDQMFRDNREITDRTLKAVLELSQNSPEHSALAELSTIALESEFNKQRGQKTLPPVSFEPSEFPFPVGKGIFIQELTRLWSSRDDMRTCFRAHDYPEIEATKLDAFVIEFVDSMTGNDAAKLAGIFECLRKKRPGSHLLTFAAAYLKER